MTHTYDPTSVGALYTRDYPASVWREVLPFITDHEFRAQLIDELHHHAEHDSISVRIDHIITDPDRARPCTH